MYNKLIRECIAFVVAIPLIVQGKININITVGLTSSDVQVTTSGEDIKLITDKEIQIFNFTDVNLNRGFRIELGKVPDNIFLKDPTPYEDLFKEFEWEPVRRKMYIKKVKILETASEKVVLKRHGYINATPDTIKSNVSSYKDVENVIYSSWSTEGVPNDEIYYDLLIYMTNNNFKYTNKWRDDQLRSKYLAVGLTKEGYFEIKPGIDVVAKLSAYKTIVLVEITYAAVLTGSIIGDYDRLYGKYHFYAPSVKSIMKAAKLKNEIITTELIEIRCYTSPTLDLEDANGQKVNVIRPHFPLTYKKRGHV